MPTTSAIYYSADSFRHYRDELNWWGYPVYPPGARCNDPGKQPAFKSWWSHSPHDVDIQKYFSNGSSYNIGVCPKSGLVFVDLDSKPDQGASVAKFLSETRELDAVPRHQTRGGVHLVFRCPDVPQWKNPKTGKPFHDRLISKINPQVNAEFFHSEHNNIVLPPSIHPTGFRYTWTVFGLVPEVEWKWIQEIFHFEEPAAHSPKAKGKAPSWDLKFSRRPPEPGLDQAVGRTGIQSGSGGCRRMPLHRSLPLARLRAFRPGG